MATGTGKSYVIFAIAYLSILMGLTKRVLVLGPASTIIEQGLREKFRDLMNRKEFNDKLPIKYRGKAINLLTDNDPIEDDSIVIVYDIYDRFRLRTFEALHFDFGSVVVDDRYPEENEIRQVIIEAMKVAGIEGTRLSEENRKESDMYFNRFLPPGEKKRIFENIEGNISPVDTLRMDRSGIRVSELERDRTAFLSEDYSGE